MNRLEDIATTVMPFILYRTISATNMILYQGDPNQKLGDFFVFSCFFIVFFGVFGVYIFPKWLKKVPGHFGILFR